jgi:hypothetical protein
MYEGKNSLALPPLEVEGLFLLPEAGLGSAGLGSANSSMSFDEFEI